MFRRLGVDATLMGLGVCWFIPVKSLVEEAFLQADPQYAEYMKRVPSRWIPYVIDQTYADELVPTTGVLSQAQTFDRLGQRYNLFIHTRADHLAFATEDRFGDAVAALGRPLAVTEPGAFTYDWYPSLTSSALGIGATGDYWLSGLSARDSSYGKIASIQAGDSALPDPTVTVQRSGTSLVTQPLPGTETQLSWSEGSRPAAARRMSLALGDVSALTVDTAAANPSFHLLPGTSRPIPSKVTGNPRARPPP